MPRTYASALRQFQRRARVALTDLRREISSRETELGELRDKETQLARLAGRVASPTPSARHSAGSGRVNWRQVLVKLPKEFRTSDLRKIGALKNKRSSEIYAGICRWTDAGLVKRKEREFTSAFRDRLSCVLLGSRLSKRVGSASAVLRFASVPDRKAVDERGPANGDLRCGGRWRLSSSSVRVGNSFKTSPCAPTN
jgi:hypothetical protein